MKLPIQPVYKDNHGVHRFKENRIVGDVLEHSTLDLNKIAMRDYTNEERMQFAQLIGYSLGGYADLSYASDDSCEIADKMIYEEISEEEAELIYLRSLLKETREKVRYLTASLFKICSEDLEY